MDEYTGSVNCKKSEEQLFKAEPGIAISGAPVLDRPQKSWREVITEVLGGGYHKSPGGRLSQKSWREVITEVLEGGYHRSP